MHFAAQEAEAGRGSHLVRGIEEELVADADAEERRAVRDGGANRVIDARLDQPRHRGAEAADAGEHELRCARDCIRVTRHVERSAGRAQRARDVRDVGDRRVDERRVHSTPFVEGTSLVTICFASRTAIANALKIASAA